MANILKLDQHLASRSYVEGYTPSQAGIAVFKAISSPSSAAQARHSWVLLLPLPLGIAAVPLIRLAWPHGLRPGLAEFKFGLAGVGGRGLGVGGRGLGVGGECIK
ncbi:hypothetical protein B0H14DRAFT_2599966 [Mycena olivaceomarginata]|nr:hypothetical protein B0H14DRAFT_2599966 [Mycena olivaceomarginata]